MSTSLNPAIEQPPGPAWLFCPGDRPERFQRALDAADAAILDLEDAVSDDAKTTARGHVYTHLIGSPAPDPRVIVRVNPAETRWHLDDLHAVRDGGAAWVLLPKAVDAASLEGAAAVLGPGVGIIALCESARAIMGARSTASAISCAALMWGSEDLAVDLAIAESRDERGRWSPLMEHARCQIRIAAAAAGCLAIDSPCVLLNAPEIVEEEARSAMQAGFYAKACIHPSQVPLVRRSFRPSESRVAWAHQIVAAAARSSNGVFSFEGKMIDEPLIATARLVLQRADS